MVKALVWPAGGEAAGGAAIKLSVDLLFLQPSAANPQLSVDLLFRQSSAANPQLSVDLPFSPALGCKPSAEC